MFVIENFERDFHSFVLLKKFCGDDINYRYDKKSDTMYIDTEDAIDNCEELYENFLSDSRNITGDEELIESLKDDIGTYDDWSRRCGGC